MEYPLGDENDRNREKGIFRKALEGVLPEEVLYRKKSPYPKTHNPAYTIAVQKLLAGILQDKNPQYYMNSFIRSSWEVL